MSLDPPADKAIPAQSSETDPGRPVHADRAGRSLRERKTLVLTGASRGIGRATGKLLSEAGWRVISCARQLFDAVRCPWDIDGDSYINVDLNEHRSLPRVLAVQGAPCRGTVARTDQQRRKLTKDAERYPADVAGDLSRYLDEGVHLNLVAPILLAQGLFDELKAASGAIVNVNSIALQARHMQFRKPHSLVSRAKWRTIILHMASRPAKSRGTHCRLTPKRILCQRSHFWRRSTDQWRTTLVTKAAPAESVWT
ncbi:NAD(P)-dependent dehydrogenase (short-subunit alcohol dehydrogenase family) [Bradyrhizobium sp. JR4.1]